MSDTTSVRRIVGALAFLALFASGLFSAAWAQSANQSTGLRVLSSEPDYVDFGVGAFNSIASHDGSKTVPDGRIEYRDGNKLFSYIGPTVGIMANTRGGVYGYGGFYTDIAYDNFVVRPLAAVGGYHRGGSIDLGGVLQFRLSLEGSYELENKSRVGAEIGHMSNAGSHSKNPGENDFLLTYGVPLGSLF